MKLIVDIDENYYKGICKKVERFGKGSVVLSTPEKIIFNGIPLEEKQKTGHWIDYGMKYDVRCSICNTQYPLKPISSSHLMGWKSDYCPSCGAKMKGENNADNN